MKCDGCGKEISERRRRFNGHEVIFPFCEDCEKKLNEQSERFPRQAGKLGKKPPK
jgi:hypothetical protein